MGLFGGKKVFVASSVYNLAGDEATRPNYLKGMVLGAVLSDQDQTIPEALLNGYLAGPGIKLRQYFRWCQNHFDGPMGITSDGLASDPDVDPALVALQIDPSGGVIVQSVTFGIADFEVWAEQWMLQNHVDLFNTAWISDYDQTTGQVKVTLSDASVHSFTPADFDQAALYLYATYNNVSPTSIGPLVTGATNPVGAAPDTTGWTLQTHVPDGVGGYTDTWFKDAYTGTVTDPDGTSSTTKTRTFMVIVATVAGGVTSYTVRDDTQVTILKTWSSLQVFIYKIGSGNAALDGSVQTVTGFGGFFSPIPVRFNNQFLSDTFSPIEYGLSKQAYKRLTAGASLDVLIDKISANDSLADMSYIFVHPGVSLNVQENACRKYIYKFFENCMATQVIGAAAYNTWLSSSAAASTANQTWVTWFEAQTSPLNPGYGTPEPPRPAFPNVGQNMVEIQSGSGVNFKIQILWGTIIEEAGHGLGKPDANVGDVWLEDAGIADSADEVVIQATLTSILTGTATNAIYVWQQVDTNNWKRLTVYGLEHHNVVFEGHDVTTTATDALADPAESGFIVPIHWDTWRAMSIKDTTQMATACVFLVINSYKVVKEQWFQTGFFQIVLFVAVVAVAIMFPPAGAAALGVDLGFTGLTAIVIGALIIDTINMLAAMILFKVLDVLGTAAFGDKIGTLIATIATVLTLQIGQGLQNGLNLAQSFSHIMDPVNLIQMTEAVGKGVANLVMGGVQETLAQTQGVLDQYNQSSKAITDLYAQNIGYGNGVIDPIAVSQASQWYPETSDSFLTRTLMTGSDIAELSTSLIGRFSDLTLSTQLPT